MKNNKSLVVEILESLSEKERACVKKYAGAFVRGGKTMPIDMQVELCETICELGYAPETDVAEFFSVMGI